MDWRIGEKRVTGRKAERVATLEVNEEELEQIADSVERTNSRRAIQPDGAVALELRAAHSALVTRPRR